MNLVKLVAELREYRAQIEEAIVAMEQLARRRHPGFRAYDISAENSLASLSVQKKKRKPSKKKTR